ncbi:MAG: AbrB/MazE/SpoVT family DNA-binding domain-containing protein [Nanoarchaeota archaeon]|nr:AbrB/MazE/SpoVT family DNA-binding domain-containing protein [Nanoarchaeota archaeon]
MVELKVRLGPKGQIVIPKIFRETYKMYPQQEVIITEEKQGVLIKNNNIDILKELEIMAEKASKERKGKKINVDPHAIYEQYDERAKRAGIKV